MSFKSKQKHVSSEFDEPKYSARIRFHETSQTKFNKDEKSITKSSSIKYLKQTSPKREKSSSKFIGNKILKLLESYEQSRNHSQSQNSDNLESDPSNSSKIAEALKTIDFDQRRNCQTSRSTSKKLHENQKIALKQNMLERFKSNEAKMVLMRQDLQKVFVTYKERQRQMVEIKSSLKNWQKIKTENDFLSKEIARVQRMIKQALLERQKLKYGPFSQLSKRTTK